jgi:DNA-binding MarR family transcriptional regulator
VQRRTDALGVVERQTAVMIRHAEMLNRRTGIHDELDRAEYLLLRLLDEAGPLDINTVACSLGLDPSTAGRQVSVLEGAGLAVRTPAPTDRRRSIITPTAAGLDRMRQVKRLRTESTADLLAEWSDEDLRVLGTMLARYNTTVAERYLTGQAKYRTVGAGPAHGVAGDGAGTKAETGAGDGADEPAGASGEAHGEPHGTPVQG